MKLKNTKPYGTCRASLPGSSKPCSLLTIAQAVQEHTEGLTPEHQVAEFNAQHDLTTKISHKGCFLMATKAQKAQEAMFIKFVNMYSIYQDKHVMKAYNRHIPKAFPDLEEPELKAHQCRVCLAILYVLIY
jgi:hypothetical protein